jgi:negative regulator of flagellin synthesis FlgM
MDIRSSLEGLKSILGTTQSDSVASSARSESATSSSQSALTSDQATLSNAGSAVLDSSADSGIRMDKVTSIQAALSAGTYNVSAAAVATKLVDSMLGSNQ